jgi:hypothetical protein
MDYTGTHAKITSPPVVRFLRPTAHTEASVPAGVVVATGDGAILILVSPDFFLRSCSLRIN